MSRARPVLIIAGPTASGKSGLALAVAEAFGGTVINADALQIYRELRILTARPTPSDLARAPHRLYGELSSDRSCSAGYWCDLALREIRTACAEERLPIVVGGTGLYLRALTQGLTAIPAVPDEVRDRISKHFDTVGPEAFHRELALRDPQAAARLASSDRQRLIRAMEVVDHTGRTQSDWHDAAAGAPPPGLVFATVLIDPPRDGLYAVCDTRFSNMIGEGALDEVRSLAALGVAEDAAIMKAVGVPPLRRHLAGEISLDEAVRLGQRDTRRYAKRQSTWFRNQILPEMTLNEQYSETMSENIFPFISNFLLTGRP